MKELLKRHQEWLLTAAALLLLGILGFFFVSTVTGVALDLRKSIVPASEKNAGMNFDLEGAKRLNLKGLAQ